MPARAAQNVFVAVMTNIPVARRRPLPYLRWARMIPTRPLSRRLLACLVGVSAAIAPHGIAQTLDPALNAGANAEVFAIAVQPDGKTLIGGSFTTIGGVARQRLARFNRDGTLDASFNPGANSSVTALRIQPDGRILVGGLFTAIAGTARQQIARLAPDGSIDLAFAPAANNAVRDFAVQPDGRIIVVGTFTQLAGATRTGIGRLNANGSLDASFNPVLIGTNTPTTLFVQTALVLPNSQILIGGNFATVNNQSSAGAARLFADGSRDPSFTPAANSDVQAFLPLPSGRFLIGGSFNRVDGQTRPYLALYNANGSLDPAVPAPPNSTVRRIVMQPDGRIVIGGAFLELGAVRRTWVARLNADTSTDTTFAPLIGGSLGASSPGVYALAVTETNQILVGGAFSSVAGVERNGIARFGSPLAAIVAGPRDLFAAAGANVTLSVVASGDALLYQWKRGGVDIGGATGSTLQLNNVQAASTGVYTVSISNTLGTVTSAPATLALGPPPATTYTVTTVAGTAGQTGYVQAVGANARFNRPLGLAVDGDGSIFVMDGGNNVIREILPYGFAGTLTGFAGWGLALDRNGTLYGADADARIVRVTRSGGLTTFAGSGGRGSTDGAPSVAQFRVPRGVAVDAAGFVLVADSDNFTIRRISPTGVVSTLAGLAGVQGSVDGRGGAARFDAPNSLAVDAAGNLFVADRSAVRRITPDGTVTTIGAGAVGNALGVAVDGAGNVFVADVSGHTIRRITPAGDISVIAGLAGLSGSADGPGGTARFNGPWNLTVDAAGNVFITDNGNSTVRKAAPDALPLAITAAPTAQHTTAGLPATLNVAASGTALRYQWRKDGVAIPGATNAAYTIANPSGADMGYYTAVVSSDGSAIESTSAILTVATPGVNGRLINVATRGFVPPGETLTPGFVLRGTGNMPMLVRGVGPGLLRFGVGGALGDPRMELIPLGATTPVLSNDNWGAGAFLPELLSLTTAVGAFALEDNSSDAAAYTVLNTGTAPAYTVRITGATPTASGIALAEVYDAGSVSAPVQLANVSTRGFVGTGANALVPGFVIGGTGPLRLLIRAVGPGLAPFGVTGLLSDPQITIVPLGQETPIASNDNWGGGGALSAAFASAGAFDLPANSRDAALLVWLPPGAYTAIVSGVGGTTGTALVEIYDLP